MKKEEFEDRLENTLVYLLDGDIILSIDNEINISMYNMPMHRSFDKSIKYSELNETTLLMTVKEIIEIFKGDSNECGKCKGAMIWET